MCVSHTNRGPDLFPNPDEFHPKSWLTQKHELDQINIKSVHRSGASNQFGDCHHTCFGGKLGSVYWDIILGDGTHPGYDLVMVSGVQDGVGIDNVSVQAALEENLGTQFQTG